MKREARDWPITYDELEPYYTQAEKLIGINGTRQNQIKRASNEYYQPPLDPNPISEYARVGMDALGMQPYRTPQAVITQDHEPSGRKVGPLGDPGVGGRPEDGVCEPLRRPARFQIEHVGFAAAPDLEEAELHALAELPRHASRMSGLGDHDGEPSRPKRPQRSLSGKVVVVACSAIESVRLLMLSAEISPEFDSRINQNDLLGKYFLTHCFGGASAVMPGRFDKSLTVDSDWATDFCGTEDFIRRTGCGPAQRSTITRPTRHFPSRSAERTAPPTSTRYGTGSTMTRRSSATDPRVPRLQFNRRLSVSFMANQVPQKANRIELHPSVRDKWGRRVAYIIKAWHSHDQYLMDTIARKCRDVLAFGGDNGGGHFPSKGLAACISARTRSHASPTTSLAARGSARTKPIRCSTRTAVRGVSTTCTSVTARFMPTSGSGNPTLTIQANAFRVGDALLQSGLL